jgi:cell division protein ZapA (FtsZ GTPase activity inhibitor)
MDQKISIKIADRTFNLTAPTPETEQLYRQAAESINKRLATFTRSHPGKTASDLLSMVALNEAVIRLDMQREFDLYKNAEKQLESDLDRYLKDQTK